MSKIEQVLYAAEFSESTSRRIKLVFLGKIRSGIALEISLAAQGKVCKR